MINDHEWKVMAEKAFPKKMVQAPPFLWTRVLARIEALEERAAASWWMQWRWMSRITATVGLAVTLGAFYLLRQETVSLETSLDGRSSQEQALQMVSFDHQTPEDSVGIIVGLDS